MSENGLWRTWTADQHMDEAQALMLEAGEDVDGRRACLAQMHVQMAEVKETRQLKSFLMQRVQYVDTRSLR